MAISVKDIQDALWPHTRRAFIKQVRELLPTIPADWNPSDEDIKRAIRALWEQENEDDDASH